MLNIFFFSVGSTNSLPSLGEPESHTGWCNSDTVYILKTNFGPQKLFWLTKSKLVIANSTSLLILNFLALM